MTTNVVRLLAAALGLVLAVPVHAAPIGAPPADPSLVIQVQRVYRPPPRPIRPPRLERPSGWERFLPGEDAILEDHGVITKEKLDAARQMQEKVDQCVQNYSGTDGRLTDRRLCEILARRNLL